MNIKMKFEEFTSAIAKHMGAFRESAIHENDIEPDPIDVFQVELHEEMHGKK